MKRLLTVTISAATFLASCDTQYNEAEFYVVISPGQTASYFNDLETLSAAAGLSHAKGRASDDQGHITHVFAAHGRFIRIWSQNLPLSGREDLSRCGAHSEPYPDPGQFFVAVSSRFPFASGRSVGDVQRRIREGLIAKGYEIFEEPLECSSHAHSAPRRGVTNDREG